MRKICLIILLITGSFTIMSFQQEPELKLSDSTVKTCRKGSHQTAPFFKRLCHDCKVHFANWGGRGSCNK